MVQKRKGLIGRSRRDRSRAPSSLLPGVAARFGTLDAESTPQGTPTGNTLVWRLHYWTEVIPLANANPVTGIGLDSTQYQTDAAKQPHNDFIRAYVETGLVGLVFYVCMLVALVGNARRAVQRAPRDTLESGVAAGALACAVCFVLDSMAANVMSNVVSLWYLIAFAAAASVCLTHLRAGIGWIQRSAEQARRRRGVFRQGLTWHASPARRCRSPRSKGIHGTKRTTFR